MVATEPRVLATSLAAHGSVAAVADGEAVASAATATPPAAVTANTAEPAPQSHGSMVRSWLLLTILGCRRRKRLAIGGDPVPTRPTSAPSCHHRHRTPNPSANPRIGAEGSPAAGPWLPTAGGDPHQSAPTGGTYLVLRYALRYETPGRRPRFVIQQFMMRLSSNLRRYRWAVFAAWLLLLVPSVYLALNQSGHLTGGGFEVAGSQSLRVEYADRGPLSRPGRLPAGVGRGPARGRVVRGHDRRGGATGAHRRGSAQRHRRAQPAAATAAARPALRRHAADGLRQRQRRHGQAAAQEDRHRTATSPARPTNGKVKLYVIGQGALGAAAGEATKHDIAQAEKWNLPIVLIVLLAVFGSLAAAALAAGARHLHGRGDDGRGLPAVDVHADVGVRHVHGVDVRHRARRRLLAVHPDALPGGAAVRAATRPRPPTRRWRRPASPCCCRA